MLIYDVVNKEKVYQIIASDLRNLGVKRRMKKQPHSWKVDKNEENCHSVRSFDKVFKTPLIQLPSDIVILSSGSLVHIPQFVSQACALIEKCITHEGLFRKAGSHRRQKEIISLLDAGVPLEDKHQVIDLANVLKTFFRELPVPLIPWSYHELFVRCALLKNSSVKALLMACILLPPYHLNTLAYFAGFLKRIAEHEKQNKMSIENLAKVVGPNIMPLQETTISAIQSRLETHIVIVKILIENADCIGILPDNVTELMVFDATSGIENKSDALDSSLRAKLKNKKRRSGSLTRKPHPSASNINLRMLNGLKKMVSKSSSPDESCTVTNKNVPTSFNSLHTPSIRTGKKRKVAEPLAPVSAKKKRKILQVLPDCGCPVQGNRFTAIVSLTPNPCRDGSPIHMSRVKEKTEGTRKIRLSLDRLVSKSKLKVADLQTEDRRISNSPKIERRWSSVSGASWLNKKQTPHEGVIAVKSPSKSVEDFVNGSEQDEVFMDADVNLSDDSASLDQISDNLVYSKRQKDQIDYRNGLVDKRSKKIDAAFQSRLFCDVNFDEEEYVTIPKSEYEEIKSRVCAIESRISQEFGCMSQSNNTSQDLIQCSARKVQCAYEKTLEGASIGSTLNADHLAKRLGRELKIRRSAEHKIIRSPSARKIGNLRRRSQERPVCKRNSRHVSWRVSTQQNLEQSKEDPNNFSPKVYLKRGRPNTVYTGLIQPGTQTLSSCDTICSDETIARLDFLQKQLHTLITHTVEHTKGSPNDDDTFIDDQEELVNSSDIVMQSVVRRASSFHGSDFIGNCRQLNNKTKEIKKVSSQQDVSRDNEPIFGMKEMGSETPTERMVKWKDADCYFKSDHGTNATASQTGRASVAKLRTQNVGMVLAKAKLFDETSRREIHCPNLSCDTRAEITGRQFSKLGLTRVVKSLDSDESTGSKISVPPRRKPNKSPKNNNAKLKVLHSSGDFSPQLKMKLTIIPSQQNILQHEKQNIRHVAQRYDPQSLDALENDLKTDTDFVDLMEFNTNNYYCLSENQSTISLPPVEPQTPVIRTLKESNRNILKPDENTPCKTPHIKRTLTSKTRKDGKTIIRKQGTDSKRTPMKALAFTSEQFTTPKRQSPRNAFKSRQLTKSVS